MFMSPGRCTLFGAFFRPEGRVRAAAAVESVCSGGIAEVVGEADGGGVAAG